MKELEEEILGIPEAAELCLRKNENIKLPPNTYYLGMGASYYAAQTLFYAGANIQPEIGAEYFYRNKEKQPLGVLISQSGETTDTIMNTPMFEQIVAITNNPDSILAKSAKQSIGLYAGKEIMCSSKTFINTLITLYIGLGFDPVTVVFTIKSNFNRWREATKDKAQEIKEYLNKNTIKGLYVLGSGANIGAANETALIFSEVTRLAWSGHSSTQFNHGLKESAENSIILIMSTKQDDDRQSSKKLITLLRAKTNCLIVEIEENNIDPLLSPLTLTVQTMLILMHLAELLKIDEVYSIGAKITK